MLGEFPPSFRLYVRETQVRQPTFRARSHANADLRFESRKLEHLSARMRTSEAKGKCQPSCHRCRRAIVLNSRARLENHPIP